MERIIKGKHIQETFWSLSEFADEANKRSIASHREDIPDRPHFHYVKSIGEAVSLAKLGWADELPDALAIAESAVTMAAKEHMTDTFAPVWDVTGAEVDVARYLQGEPECMIDFPLTKTSKQGRVITLVVGRAVSGVITTDTIIRRGRVVMALALALTTLGHAVEIWADHADGTVRDMGSDYSMYQRVLVKSVNDELDPARVMFALAHPAMVRTLFFGSWDGYPAPWNEYFSRAAGRGLPRQSQPAEDRALYPEGTIFMPGIRSDHDIPDADQFLRKYLGELGLLAE